MDLNILSTEKVWRRYADDCIIVYLDTFMNQVNVTQLSQLGFSTKSFTNSNQCNEFIMHLSNVKVYCLIADRLVEDNILWLNGSPLVMSIYIICTNEQRDSLSTEHYSKVKGIYDDILRIIMEIKQDILLLYRNSTPVTILSAASLSQPTDTLNAMFMYCELLKEIFLEMNHDEQAKWALVDLCKCEYENNDAVLRVIDEFGRDYEKHSPTWWYSRDCFLYRMLNKALRVHDIEVIGKFGFFIKDLYRQLEDLHGSLLSEKFTVYRGQR